jgi:hypothetical protein
MIDPMTEFNQALPDDIFDKIRFAARDVAEEIAQSFRILEDQKKKPANEPKTIYKVTVWISVSQMDNGKESLAGPAEAQSDKPQGHLAAPLNPDLVDDATWKAYLKGIALTVFHFASGRPAVQVICKVEPSWAAGPFQIECKRMVDQVGITITETWGSLEPALKG